MSLTAEQKNATMNEERAFLTKLLESALQNQFPALKDHVESYQQKHNASSTIDNDNKMLSSVEIISQFRDGKRRTALHFACQARVVPEQDKDIVEQMLEWLEEQEKKEKSASSSNDSGTGSSSTSLESLIRLKDKDGLTPIMLAAQVISVDRNDGDKAVKEADSKKIAESRVLALLKRADKLGLARSRAGATALHYAAGAGATSTCIQALFKAGQVALQTSSRQGGTPLHWAVAVPPPAQYNETIQALLDAGANIHYSQQKSDSTSPLTMFIPPPLHIATAAGNTQHAQLLVEEMVRRQLDMGPTLKFLLPGNISIYHMFADLNWVALLNFVVQHTSAEHLKVVKEQRNDEGLTALEVAAREKHEGSVLVLLGEGHSSEDAQKLIQEWHGGKLTRPVDGTQNKEGDKQQQSSADENKEGKQHEASGKPNYRNLEDEAAKAAAVVASIKVSKEKQKEALVIKEQGNQKFAGKQYQQAVTLYTQAIVLDPSNATLYSNRSACYYKLTQYTDALRDAVTSHTLRPDWPKAAYRIAVARLALHQFEDAAMAAFDGLKQDPDNEELKQLVQQCVQEGREEFQGKQKNSTSDNANPPGDSGKDTTDL